MTTGRTLAADGTPLTWQATGEGPAVVLVHGAASDARQWDRVVPLLADRFRVVAVDRRGRRESGRTSPDHTREVEYADIAAVARSFPPPVYLVGHSSGARFCLHAAPLVPALAGLVLYEPPPPETFGPGVLDRLAAMEAAGDAEGILATFLVDVAANPPGVIDLLRRRPVWPLMLANAASLPAELRAVQGYRFDPTAFTTFDVPTLCLLGGDSGPELAAVVHEIAAALADARVGVLEGQGHGAMLSAPTLFAAEVARFVEQHLPIPPR